MSVDLGQSPPSEALEAPQKQSSGLTRSRSILGDITREQSVIQVSPVGSKRPRPRTEKTRSLQTKAPALESKQQKEDAAEVEQTQESFKNFVPDLNLPPVDIIISRTRPRTPPKIEAADLQVAQTARTLVTPESEQVHEGKKRKMQPSQKDEEDRMCLDATLSTTLSSAVCVSDVSHDMDATLFGDQVGTDLQSLLAELEQDEEEQS
ncbi:MAG: hypothetical protein MHM6MM_005664 [Cercozoa sp. M6MM]